MTYNLVATAQLSAVGYKREEYDQFRGSKTYVVLSGDEKFDAEIKSAASELWKITPLSFINNSEFEKLIPEKSASFINLIILEGGGIYHYLALFNGGKEKIEKYHYNDMLAYCPINFSQNENKLVDCSYRVRNMLESMIQAMEIVEKNDIRGNSLKIVNGLQKIYNSKASIIKERTLLFCDVTIGNKITKSDISGIYPFKFEICSKEKIEQVIKDKNKDYYYYQPGITQNKSMFVFDPSNGEVVYFGYNMMGSNINKGNIKDLAETISGKK